MGHLSQAICDTFISDSFIAKSLLCHSYASRFEFPVHLSFSVAKAIGMGAVDGSGRILTFDWQCNVPGKRHGSYLNIKHKD